MLRLAPWLAAVACTLALVGCGGGEEAAPPPALPSALAVDLAAASEAVAERLEAGDVCGAARQADALKNAAGEAIAAGEVPAALRAPLRKTTIELQNEVNCPPPPAGPLDCDALEEELAALEEELKDTKGKGRKRRLEEQIAALEQQIEECRNAQGEED